MYVSSGRALTGSICLTEPSCWFSIELPFSDSRDIYKIVCRRISQSVDHTNIHELTLYTPSLQYCWQQKQVIIFIHHNLWYSRKINNNKLFYRTLHNSKLLYIYCCCYEYKITSYEQRFLTKGQIQVVYFSLSWLYTLERNI